MNKLILNRTNEFDIESYSRHTNISDGIVYSSANITFPDSTGYNALVALSTSPITDLIISNDGTSIYHLSDQNGSITSIYESLTSDNRVVLSATITFNPPPVTEE